MAARFTHFLLCKGWYVDTFVSLITLEGWLLFDSRGWEGGGQERGGGIFN